MPGGRPRKPRALKLVQGTDRPDRENKRAPAPPSAPLPPPQKDLNPHEKRAWRELAALVDPLRVAAPADVVAFRHLVYCLGQVEQARAALRKAGSQTFETVSEGGVSVKKRPEVEIIATFEKILDAKLGRFGLTPAEREKVTKAGDDGVGDPLDEFAVGGTGA
ncbi:MAG: P27 family phage terminase small subunit [Patescibacteria group bacterium]